MRQLRNGAGEAVTVSTSADGPLTAAWWADTWRLGMGQSEGDRSVIGTALRERDEGEASVVVTMAGSASEELWKRLCRLGYLESVRTADLPETLRFLDQTRAFALTDLAHEVTRLPLLLASWSATAKAGLDPDDVRPVVDAICGLPLPPARTLEGLRADLANPANRFRQDEGSAVLQFLGTDLLAKAGLIERDDVNE